MKAICEIGNEKDRKKTEGAVRHLQNPNPRMDNGGEKKMVTTGGGENRVAVPEHTEQEKEPRELRDRPSLSSEYSA